MQLTDPQGVKDGTYHILLVLLSIFYPSQGLFNAIVYIRPRVLQWKSRFPNSSIYFVLYNSLFTHKPAPTTRKPINIQGQQQHQEQQQHDGNDESSSLPVLTTQILRGDSAISSSCNTIYISSQHQRHHSSSVPTPLLLQPSFSCAAPLEEESSSIIEC